MSQRPNKDFSNDLRGGFLKKLWNMLWMTWKMSFGGVRREVVTVAGWTGNAFAVTFITPTTPSAFTIGNTTGTASGIAYPAGLTLYGPITAITPAAGEIVWVYCL